METGSANHNIAHFLEMANRVGGLPHRVARAWPPGLNYGDILGIRAAVALSHRRLSVLSE